MTQKQTLVSGIRPTGDLHLGNYIGAMKDIHRLQKEYEAYFFIVDLHALTTHPKPELIKPRTRDAVRSYLGAGLDPNQATIYAQSSLAAEISELHLYLSMVMHIGELLRCPTFKEKAKQHADHVSYGLVGYPVLMAADMFIHGAHKVPVGADQLVHIEIARDIARKFNSMYGEILTLPNGMVEKEARVPSLGGKGKMSKSLGAKTYISLQDSKETIENKVKRAYSDPTRTHLSDPGHPTVDGCNVYHLHSYFSNEEVRKDIEKRCSDANIGCVRCKQMLSESIIELTEPMQKRALAYSDIDVDDILREGAKKTQESAQVTIAKVRKAIGLIQL
ncbi:tryptophanyl-tRNA synthetase [Alkalihalophilus pseudofirmus OF4]|uniref:Tryptophan--tRNA ligase n=1 Tax=Alkalihalophilus pseudofirmus (strain ATCC BAA-2126 / JCM 17055 / OF4) TaxID=398511 RepID=D3FSV2_ALKPO|nr:MULTISPECIES: tryptophan--tRNA ligase [Alkalihalophilus]ADC51817.1 tryptophanyl-tRNA synthetase [Alkalihalophilus pseudofirmus OF4]MED1599746.1 tryptophan--tRNA ligase [Alkalihalophilus marmarensis]